MPITVTAITGEVLAALQNDPAWQTQADMIAALRDAFPDAADEIASMSPDEFGDFVHNANLDLVED